MVYFISIIFKEELSHMDLFNLLAPTASVARYNLYIVLSVTIMALVLIVSIAAIVIVLMQPGNSTGINALGGSSETFFGKNKGKSIEEKLKKVTYACLIIIGVLSVAFYVLQNTSIWD